MQDEDLKFLANCSNEELDFLVEIILDKGHVTETLSIDDTFKENQPNHLAYIDKIEQEILSFGGNSFKNLIGLTPTYKEILIIVCKKMKVNFDEEDSVETIEDNLLAEVSEQCWNDLSEDDQKALIQTLDITTDMNTNKGALTFLTIFKMGGLKSYKLSLYLINFLSQMIFKRGLSLAANATLARTISIITGPIGWTITAIWTAVDIAGPAYRVIVPLVIYISALRKIYNVEEMIE